MNFIIDCHSQFYLFVLESIRIRALDCLKSIVDILQVPRNTGVHKRNMLDGVQHEGEVGKLPLILLQELNQGPT
jgi:hypothetical protein